MRRRDLTQWLLLCAAARAVIPRAARAQACHYDKTPAEIAAGVAIADSSRCPGDWGRYGADPTGRTDSTAAIQAACNANKLAFDSAGGTYVVSERITVPSGCTVRGAGASLTQITCANGGISLFYASGATAVAVEKIKLTVTGVSAEAHTAPVEFYKSSNCICRDCEMVGCNWAGVLLYDSTYCTVDRCYFHDFQGSVHDSSDVCIYTDANHNTVTNNRCFGGNWHGVMIQDPYKGSLPSNNLVANNIVGWHQGYGIMVYVPTAGNTFNQLKGNTVENIQGSVLENNSGAGIYVVGAGAGGTTVANNTVRNCCVQTKQRSLAPAGIGINGISQSAAPVNVTGNTVLEIQAHDAILIVSSKGSVVVSGNNATLPSGNSTGTPIRIDASSNVSVTGNSAKRAAETNGRCIFVYANAVSMTHIAVTGNSCYGGNYAQIEFAAVAGGMISNVVCSNNVCEGTGSNENCIRAAGVPGISNTDNRCVPRQGA